MYPGQYVHVEWKLQSYITYVAMATGPADHEFLLGGVATTSLFLSDEETERKEEHLSLLGSRLTACLNVECILEMGNGGMGTKLTN